MMNYINAIIFGVIQGITEFLPVSSSGHLVILHNFISIPVGNELVFDIILHFATLIAVVFFFRRDIWELIVGWLKTLRGERNDYGRVAWLIVLGTIPAGLAGYFLDDYIETVLRSPFVVAFMLIAVGILFIIVEKYSRQIGELRKINWKQAFLIGLAQMIALIPGTSRSGITIIAGMGTDLKREEAVRFSFLLSIPLILGAVIKKAPDVFGARMGEGELVIIVLSFLAALISGVLAIKFFLSFAKKYSLKFFAYYRFLLASLLLLYLFFFQ